MTKRKTKNKFNQRNENENPTVETFRKQTRFGIKSQIQGRNNLRNCLLCGASFKKVEHWVIKSERGLRLHLCKSCAVGYPSARPYTTTTTRQLRSKV